MSPTPDDPRRDMVVHPRIVDAVAVTNDAVLGKAETQASGALAQMVAQTLGMAVQDGVDHLQSSLTIDSAVTGKALAMILAGDDDQDATKAMTKANQAVQFAIQDLEEIGKAVAAVISDISGATGGSPI